MENVADIIEKWYPKEEVSCSDCNWIGMCYKPGKPSKDCFKKQEQCKNKICKYRNDAKPFGCYWETRETECKYTEEK